MAARALPAALAVLALAVGCGGGSAPEPEAQPPAATTTPPPPATTEAAPPATATEEVVDEIAGIPRYAWPYRDWTKLNAEPVPPRDSDPHLGTKEVYASRALRADGLFPRGTIVVKEAVRPGKDFIGLLAVMRKQRGADPEHNDWVFVEYTRENAQDPFAETASGAVCWSCHMGAAEADYVWVEQLGLTR